MRNRNLRFGVVFFVLIIGGTGAGTNGVGPDPKLARREIASVDGVWKASEVAKPLSRNAEDSRSRGVRSFQLNPRALSRILREAPLESPRRSAGKEMTLPMPDGGFSKFLVEESPIVAPGGEQGSSRIRTYRFRGLDDPTAMGRLSWTGSRLHALILSEHGSFFVAPLSREEDLSYSSTDDRVGGGSLRCGVTAQLGRSEAQASVTPSFGTDLRTFRLVIAATAEYTAIVSGGVSDPATAKDLAYDEIVATVNAVNAVYERDLAIRLLLLPKADELKIIYTDPVTDPYTSGDRDMMMPENQANLDAVILSDNYDIGHVFDECSGGKALIGCVCSPTSKAQGVSGGVCENESFKFQTHYLIHEGGHQFGAPHTLNYPDPAGQYSSTSAYEIGSGSTIMSYAGCDYAACANESLQIFPDRYFHTNSIEAINDLITNGGGTCRSLLPTGNQPPNVSAGPDFTIPKHTPFKLTATASDADGDPVRYCWEEYDLGATNPPNDDADGQPRPILRSFPPVLEPSRTFPQLGYILGSSNDPPETYQGVDKAGNPRTYLVGESLPRIGRTMTFRVTARDGRGGVSMDDMQLQVDGASGPFAVTSPNTAVVWLAASTQTVTWDPAGTANSPVSCANVDILLSLDGGRTFPIGLAANTANDGAQAITVPSDASSIHARVKVAAAGNVFFDISDQAFVINQQPKITCPAGITVNNDPDQCGAVVNFAPTVIDDQGSVTVACAPPSGSFFGKGTTHVVCTVTDPYGAQDTCGFDVTVTDAQVPTINDLLATPSVLSPPNHKMVPVTISVTVTDNCDAHVLESCRIISVTSNEPISGTGDGDSAPDWEITGNLTLNLRAERAGSGTGRIYTITVQCTDSAGNSASGSTSVTVPHP